MYYPDSYKEAIHKIKHSYQKRALSEAWQKQYNNLLNMRSCQYRSQLMIHFSKSCHAAGIDDLKNLSILEVGCGSGNTLQMLILMGASPHKVFGVDIRNDALLNARYRCPNINLIQTDGLYLPFTDNYFDIVLQTMVFMNLEIDIMRHRLSEEMTRCLRIGGYIYWWDTPTTLPEFGSYQIKLSKIFPGMSVRKSEHSWLPLPSQCLARKRWEILFGWLIDRLAHKPTHVGALIGPKP